MVDLEQLLNLSGCKVEDKLKDSITEVKKELSGLDVEQMCRVYSGHLHEKLRNRHVMCRLVDTSDFGVDYSHQFILVKDNSNYYLSDLTVKQFGNDEYLTELLEKGYDKFDSVKWAYYLSKFDCYGAPPMNDIFDGSFKSSGRGSK